MLLRQRALADAVDSDGSVWELYPDALSITYEHGNDLVVWRVELGTSAATRETIVGYADGERANELVLAWAEAGDWAAAGQFAISRIVEAMTSGGNGDDQ